jgi:hypothetical protein
VLGSVNRWKLAPKVARGDVQALRWTRISVRAELALLAVILALTAALGELTPPRHLRNWPDPARSASGHGRQIPKQRARSGAAWRLADHRQGRSLRLRPPDLCARRQELSDFTALLAKPQCRITKSAIAAVSLRSITGSAVSGTDPSASTATTWSSSAAISGLPFAAR